MIRKLLVTATAALMPVALVVATYPGAAVASGPPRAVGTANCPIYSGKGTLNPGLTPAGSPGGVKIAFKATLTSPTGAACANSSITKPAGVTIIGGTVTGSGYYNGPSGASTGNSCSEFDGPDVLGQITITIKWLTTGGPIANTKIVYSGNSGTVNGSPTDTITLDTPPAASATKTGSFHAPATVHKVQLQTDIPGPACGPGPYSRFNILGGSVLV